MLVGRRSAWGIVFPPQDRHWDENTGSCFSLPLILKGTVDYTIESDAVHVPGNVKPKVKEQTTETSLLTAESKLLRRIRMEPQEM
jgi:hypothetical protein